MERAKKLSQWKANITNAWPELTIKDVKIEVKNNNGNGEYYPKSGQLKVGSELNVSALLRLGKINPEDISVELYHGSVDSWGNIEDGTVVRMEYLQKDNGDGEGEYWFKGRMPCDRSGRRGVAVRVLPKHPDLATAHELGLILWESPN